MSNAFSGKQERVTTSNEYQIKQLHAKIGELTVEKDFLQVDAQGLFVLRVETAAAA